MDTDLSNNYIIETPKTTSRPSQTLTNHAQNTDKISSHTPPPPNTSQLPKPHKTTWWNLLGIKATMLIHPQLPPKSFTVPTTNPQTNPYKWHPSTHSSHSHWNPHPRSTNGSFYLFYVLSMLISIKKKPQVSSMDPYYLSKMSLNQNHKYTHPHKTSTTKQKQINQTNKQINK